MSPENTGYKTEDDSRMPSAKQEIQRGRDYLLFDGDCGICTWFAEWAGRMRGKRLFEIIPYQFIPESSLLEYGVNYQKCSKKLQVITPKGRVHAGAFGINYFLWHRFPWNVLVIIIYLLPVLVIAEMICYHLVAKNRHHISRWFGMQACLLRQRG